MTTSDRLLNILGLFTIEQPEWTVEAAASELGLAVSTAYRYFRSLSKAGLIVAFATGRYVLGPAIIQFDRQIRLRDPLTTAAQPVMKHLGEQVPSQSVMLLCRLFRNQVMCVHQEAAEKPEFAFSYERGRALPLFRGASSKIILAHMPLRTVKALYGEHSAKFTQAALGKSWEDAKTRLRALRTAGFSITQGEVDPGMCGIAVPVFEPGDAVVGSLSIVMPARHVTPNLLSEAPQRLKEASGQIRWALSLGVEQHESPQLVIAAEPGTLAHPSTNRSQAPTANSKASRPANRLRASQRAKKTGSGRKDARRMRTL